MILVPFGANASTLSEMSEDAQEIAGIPLGLVRFSLDLTGSIERWNQLNKTLKQF
jgi:hypothetical protein